MTRSPVTARLRSVLVTRLRSLAIPLTRTTLRVTLSVLSRVWPQTRSVVVSAFPETEGNGLETARALVAAYDGTVVWLLDGHRPAAEVLELSRQGMVLVEKSSLAGVLAYLRAEAVLFTHGLYGSPRPAARKPLVNLWHGDGPKETRPGNEAGSLIPSTYLVGSTQVFTELKGRAFEVPRDRLLITGNPRTDQLWHGVPDEALERLGLTGDFVVYMPTFRRTRALGAVLEWSEVEPTAAVVPTEPATGERTLEPLAAGVQEQRDLAPLLAGLAERGLTLVIKPHPMDADRRGWPGAVTLTERDLVAAGVSLYALMGRSRGLVTDYSSVWVDYLLLDRPLAFLVPDVDTYSRRLKPADILDWLPGERVDLDDAPFERFLGELDGHPATGDDGSAARAEVGRRLGLNDTRTSAPDLVEALSDLGVVRVRGSRTAG